MNGRHAGPPRARWRWIWRMASAVLLAATVTCAPAKQEVVFWQFWPSDVVAPLIEKFEKENNVKVTLDDFDSNDTLLAKVRAGNTGYDIVVPSDVYVAQMVELDLLEPLDKS